MLDGWNETNLNLGFEGLFQLIFFSYFMCYFKTFYRFRKSNRSSKPLYPYQCFTCFAAGVSKWNCNKIINMFSNRFLEYSLLPLDKQIFLP